MTHSAAASPSPMPAPAGSEFAEPLTLRDGRPVWLRIADVGDERAILDLLTGLSLSKRRMSFFSSACKLRATADLGPEARGVDQYALVALDRGARIVGHAVYSRRYGSRAEVAVEVAEDYHSRGLGTMLLSRLARVAQVHGIGRFVAEVLPENRQLLAVFHEGCGPTQRLDDGAVEVEFRTASWQIARQRFGCC